MENFEQFNDNKVSNSALFEELENTTKNDKQIEILEKIGLQAERLENEEAQKFIAQSFLIGERQEWASVGPEENSKFDDKTKEYINSPHEMSKELVDKIIITNFQDFLSFDESEEEMAVAYLKKHPINQVSNEPKKEIGCKFNYPDENTLRMSILYRDSYHGVEKKKEVIFDILENSDTKKVILKIKEIFPLHQISRNDDEFNFNVGIIDLMKKWGHGSLDKDDIDYLENYATTVTS